MIRTIGALLAAALAGPYAFVVLSGLLSVTLSPGVPRLETAVLVLPMVAFMGALGFILICIPALSLGAAAIVLAQVTGLYSRRYAVCAGAMIGSGLAFLLLDSELHSEIVRSWVTGAVAGAIGGWTYWRIASRPRSCEGPATGQPHDG